MYCSRGIAASQSAELARFDVEMIGLGFLLGMKKD